MLTIEGTTTSTGLNVTNLATFQNASTSQLNISGLGNTSAACLRVDTAGAVSAAAQDCGSGGGSDSFTHPTYAGSTISATSTIVSFTGGLVAHASTTIGNGTQVEGLTIAGGATTTLQAYFGSKVAIGTTTPWGLLSVNANGLLNGIPQFVVGSSTATNLVVANGGYIGIGTSSPWAPLAINYNTYVASTLGTIFAIGSTSASGAESNLFTIDNTGLTTVGNTAGTGNASLQFAGDTDAWNVGFNSTDKSFNIASSTSFASNVALTISKSTLNLGISSTTPWKTLSVVGSGIVTTTFNLPGIAATSTAGTAVCWGNAGGNPGDIVKGTGTTACSASSQRFKEDISPLEVASGLAEVMALNPVSFKYTEEYLGGFASDSNWNGTFVGFIAEEVAQVDPRLVTVDEQGIPNNVAYPNITSILTKGVQELVLQVDPLTGATTSAIELTTASSSVASTTPWVASFANASAGLKSGILALGDTVVHAAKDAFYAATGVFNKVFAGEVHTDTLCVSDASGETCVTRSQLNNLLSGGGGGGGGAPQTGGSAGGGAGGGTTPPPPPPPPSDGGTGTTTPSTGGSGSDTTPPDTTAPVVSLNGSPIMTINQGDAWSDPGATALDNVDGDLTAQIVETGSVDSSTPDLYTLTYTATDAAGNTGSASRVVTVTASSGGTVASAGGTSGGSTDTGGTTGTTDTSTTPPADTSTPPPPDTSAPPADTTTL
jgi:hypothetical protein